MQKERTEEQLRLIALNKRFLTEVENGAEWSDVRWLLDEMKEIARNFDHIEPATVLAMTDYPRNNLTNQQAQGSNI